MTGFKRLVDFYVRSSGHVAVCFVALFACLHYNRLSIFYWEIYVVLFTGALIGYNLIKYADLIYLDRKFFYRKSIISITVISTVAVGIILLQENLLSLCILAISGGIGMLYMLPFYKGKGLRSIHLLKISSVAISWAVLLVIYPLFSEFQSEMRWNGSSIIRILIEFVEVLVLISALCMPFEIRDLKYDAPDLKTLPQLIGVRRTKILGISLTLIFVLSQLFQIQEIESIATFIPIINGVVLCTIILKSNVKRHDYYASIMTEAFPLFWLLLLFTLL